MWSKTPNVVDKANGSARRRDGVIRDEHPTRVVLRADLPQSLVRRFREQGTRVDARLHEVQIATPAVPGCNALEHVLDTPLDRRLHLRVGREAEREEDERLVD